MAAGNGQGLHEATQASIAGELGYIRLLLESVLSEERADILQILTGNFDYREMVLLDSPLPKTKRLLVPRQGQGGDAVPLTTTAVQILSGNEGRLGGVARCRDATNAAIIYLCSIGDMKQSGARPAIFLPVNGAAPWDFRLGNVLYAGPVCAAAAAATSTLTVAEF